MRPWAAMRKQIFESSGPSTSGDAERERRECQLPLQYVRVGVDGWLEGSYLRCHRVRAPQEGRRLRARRVDFHRRERARREPSPTPSCFQRDGANAASGNGEIGKCGSENGGADAGGDSEMSVDANDKTGAGGSASGCGKTDNHANGDAS
jgi:hypothetical protein